MSDGGITLQQATDRLLAGKELEWETHGDFVGGRIELANSGQRRLCECLLNSSPEILSTLDENLYAAIVAAWKDEENDPAAEIQGSEEAEIGGSFRLQAIETETFGGLNIHGRPPFKFEVGRESWCLEGQNGSGKTSLASAILWALTGYRIRENDGPFFDEGKRAPVLNDDGDKIGTWPPLVTYPSKPEDLSGDARVRVKLIFADEDGNEVIAEREIISKADGEIEVAKKDISPGLTVSPQLIDVGLLMPCRLGQMSFGEKSQSIYEAVKMLTGLDFLGVVGDAAAAITHKGRKFLKYARDNRIEDVVKDFARTLKDVEEKAKQVNFDLSKVSDIGKKDVDDELAKLAAKASTKAQELLAKLENEVTEDIDLSKHAGRKRIGDTLTLAKDVAKKGSNEVEAFRILIELREAEQAGDLAPVNEAIGPAVSRLEKAFYWHQRQLEDVKLRLKALASQSFEIPEDPQALANCPLCDAQFSSPEQKALAEELSALKDDAELAARNLADVCGEVRSNLAKTLPQRIRSNTDKLIELDPKAAVEDGAKQLFVVGEVFNKVLIAIGKAMAKAIDQKGKKLPTFEWQGEPIDEDLPQVLRDTNSYIDGVRRILGLAIWWSENRQTFEEFWSELVGPSDPKVKAPPETLQAHLQKLEEAFDQADPYDQLAVALEKASEHATKWRQIQDEQELREAIADALQPLKELRAFVDTETARAISDLSGRMGEILDEIRLRERLKYKNTELDKKVVNVHGGFADGMKIDALPVANTSWLRAILWSFILALREKTIAALGSNPFPLMVLDDPQKTFDPRNERQWAKKIAELASSNGNDSISGQIFLTTYESGFVRVLTEFQKFKGQSALVGAANDVNGHVTISNGTLLERKFAKANDKNDDAIAREYIGQVRIHVENLLKYMLRAEGPHIANGNLESLRKDLGALHADQVRPFNSQVFEQMLKAIEGGQKYIKLMSDPHHANNPSIGVAQAEEVREYWTGILQKRIVNAFRVFEAFEAYAGDPRTFDFADTIVKLPNGHNDEIAKIELFSTGGLSAAAKSDGRAGDGLVLVEQWKNTEKLKLYNHAIYRLSANTLEPVAAVGDVIITCDYASVHPKNLVVVPIGERVLVRRFNETDLGSSLGVFTASAINPYEIAPPVIHPLHGIKMTKVVGILFGRTLEGPPSGEDEVVEIDDPNPYLDLMNGAHLFQVAGRSAEPIALDGQYILAGEPLNAEAAVKSLDGTLTVAYDKDGTAYLKRLRLTGQSIVLLESLNPDGTTPTEVLSLSDTGEFPMLDKVLPVLGVLFELQESENSKS